MNVLIESPIVVVGYSIEEFFILIHALQSWSSETLWRFLVSKHVVPQKNVSPLVQAWILQPRSQSIKSQFWANIQVEKVSIFFLLQNPDGADLPNGAMHFEFSRYSKLIFLRNFWIDLLHEDPNPILWSCDKSID